MATNLESQNVNVFTSSQMAEILDAIPVSNVILRDKRADRYIVLKNVHVFTANGAPTQAELLSAWKSMYFNTWKMKFTIEQTAGKDLKCGNVFRNLDRFDVCMYVGSVKIFDTADFNLDLVEGRVGLTPKSKTWADFPTNKALKAHCYTVAESAWKLLKIDSLVSKSIVEAEKETAGKIVSTTGKKSSKNTPKEKTKKPAKDKKNKEVVENAPEVEAVQSQEAQQAA